MYKNLLKEKLEAGKNVTGCLIQVPAPQLVEALAAIGFDFVFIDTEHTTLTIADVENLIRAADLTGITPVVRVHNNDQGLILRYMDAGVQGLIVPGVRNAEEAQRVVNAVKYYPEGKRGLSIGRASDYGLKMPMKDYIPYANSQTLVLPSMENIEAVNNIEEILAVENVDGVLFGTSDLSMSLGHPGEANHPEVVAAVEKALSNGLKSGKILGSVVRAGETPQDYFSVGYRIVMTNVYALLAQAGRNFVELAK
jgi:4-hydroxy-2-oxoheptanedioate aldolase